MKKIGEFQLETEETGEYFRDLKWMPDGSTILSLSSTGYSIFSPLMQTAEYHEQQQQDLQPQEETCHKQGKDTIEIKKVGEIKEACSIFDYCWYPFAQVSYPETCCFLSSSRKQPIKLWDTSFHKIRCSYVSKDGKDEIVGAHSVIFDKDANRIISGYEHSIRIHHTDRPGSDCMEFETTPTRKSKHGQKVGELLKQGIISCLDIASGELLAAGSFSKSVSLYDLSSGQLVWIDSFPTGVTQVKFHGEDRLIVAGRQSSILRCYDLRSTGQILWEIDRRAQTNQRLFFDSIDGSISGNDLVGYGGIDGSLNIHQMNVSENERIVCNLFKSVETAHNDVISSVRFNPADPNLLATCSGQRHFHPGEDPIESSIKIWSL